VIDHDDLVGQSIGLVEVLRGEQDRRAFGHERADHPPQLEPAPRVQAGRRLVQVQEPRTPDQARGEVEPPPHPARVRLDVFRRSVRQIEGLEQFGGSGSSGRWREAQQPTEHEQVVLPGEQLVDRGVLAGQPDQAPHLRGLPHHVEAADRGTAGVRPKERGEDPDRGGLAGAIGSEKAEDRALSGHHVDAVERTDLPERLDEALGLDR
jgi:hypothetical protein